VVTFFITLLECVDYAPICALNEQPYLNLTPEKTGMRVVFYGFVISAGIGDNLILILTHDGGKTAVYLKQPTIPNQPTILPVLDAVTSFFVIT